MYPENPTMHAMWHSIEEAAPRLSIEAIEGGVHNTAEIERVVESFAQKPAVSKRFAVRVRNLANVSECHSLIRTLNGRTVTQYRAV